MMDDQVKRFATPSRLYEATASAIIQLLNEAIDAREKATLVLSGGSTPKAVYDLLASEPLRSGTDWQKVHVFWGDERSVHPGHSESNFRMAKDSFLQKNSIPESNIHRIESERPPQEAAEHYEKDIRKFFHSQEGDGIPRFDIMLLGMGDDGHTASLFPGTTILNEFRRLVAEVFVPRLNTHRISMTYPLINNSRSILFLISGAGKASVFRDVLEGKPVHYPSQHIRPVNGMLFWYCDAAAASQLTDAKC